MRRNRGSSQNREHVDGLRLSPRQREVFEYFIERIRIDGLPPTVREIGEQLGLRANTVHNHLRMLVQKKALRQLKHGRRGYVPTLDRTCPCCGRNVGPQRSDDP